MRLIESAYSKYNIATTFNIVSPVLDNYTYVLFTVYSNPESNYPVLICVSNNGDHDNIKYGKNEVEFIKALTLILGSDKTTETISTLYSKSKNY